MSQNHKEMIEEALSRDGGYAYPVTIEDGGLTLWAMGMTMRQAYKLAVLQSGLLHVWQSDANVSRHDVAGEVGRLADAMIQEDEAHERGGS